MYHYIFIHIYSYIYTYTLEIAHIRILDVAGTRDLTVPAGICTGCQSDGTIDWFLAARIPEQAESPARLLKDHITEWR